MKTTICKFSIRDKVHVIPMERDGVVLDINIRGDDFIFYRVRYIDKADVQIKEFLENELKIIRVKK